MRPSVNARAMQQALRSKSKRDRFQAQRFQIKEVTAPPQPPRRTLKDSERGQSSSHLNTLRSQMRSKQKAEIFKEKRQQLLKDKGARQSSPVLQPQPQPQRQSMMNREKHAAASHLDTIRAEMRSKHKSQLFQEKRQSLLKPSLPTIPENKISKVGMTNTKPTAELSHITRSFDSPSKKQLNTIREEMRSKQKQQYFALRRNQLKIEPLKPVPQPPPPSNKPKQQESWSDLAAKFLIIEPKQKKLKTNFTLNDRVLPTRRPMNLQIDDSVINIKGGFNGLNIRKKRAKLKRQSFIGTMFTPAEKPPFELHSQVVNQIFLPPERMDQQIPTASVPISQFMGPEHHQSKPQLPFTEVNNVYQTGVQKIKIAQDELGHFWIGATLNKDEETIFTINSVRLQTIAEVRQIIPLFYEIIDMEIPKSGRIVLPFSRSNVAMIRDIYRSKVYVSLRQFCYFNKEPYLTRNGFNLLESEFYELCDYIQAFE